MSFLRLIKNGVDNFLGTLMTMLTIGIALGLGFMVSGWLFDRDAPTEILDRTIDTPNVMPGGEFCYDTSFIRHKICETLVFRFYEDSDHKLHGYKPEEIELPSSDVGETAERRTCYPVPSDMPEGEASFNIASRFVCNPLHRYLWPIYAPILTFPIKVVPGERK